MQFSPTWCFGPNIFLSALFSRTLSLRSYERHLKQLEYLRKIKKSISEENLCH
jgi:hypothetical protein